ncbi:MAG: hypothetical protein ACRC0A_07255 [Chitinophagaceae bacterium]
MMYSHAQSARQESVKELFRMMKQDSFIEKMFIFIVPMILQQMQVKILQEKNSLLLKYTM